MKASVDLTENMEPSPIPQCQVAKVVIVYPT